MMQSFQIDLEQVEADLLSRLELDVLQLAGHVQYESNAEIALALTLRLIGRDAIPEHRRRYFTDPEFNAGGRGRSRQQMFERNGLRREEIIKHPHFLPYLRYFIFGAELPDAVRDQFRARVEACGLVTSSDIVPLGRSAKDLARRFNLEAYKARDEFYKLALDCGLDVFDASSVRKAVGTIR